MLVNKYAPKKLDEVVGQDEAIAKIKEWIKSPKKGLLVYGPPGTGKTATAHALAKELDLELVEMNASDFRRKADVNERLINAAQQKSLFSKSKLILVDEVDGIAGRKDMGAPGAISELIKKSHYPVYLTCNNNWANPVKAIKNDVIEVKFDKPKAGAVFKLLEKINKIEQLGVERSVLIQLSTSKDIRSAISDMQAGYGDERNRNKTQFEALRDVFKSTTFEQARTAFEGLNTNIDEFMLWIDQNIVKEYVQEDLARAYEALSRADVFRGRIFRRQDWKLLKYVIDLSTAGVGMAKTEVNNDYTAYAPPTFLSMMGRTKFTRATRKSLLSKIAKHTHTSTKRAIDYLPVVKMMDKAGELPFKIDEKERSLLQSI
ncbi:MAG: replication factor C large subunit [Candidatus Altiarchaeota archaeon]|nr:replication factor C large subunit [Candidatus Altiarchaeota archaeon]